MAMVKSDAMLQHEKWIEWVTEQNPKWIPGMDKPVNLLPETPELVMASAAVIVVMAAALDIFL